MEQFLNLDSGSWHNKYAQETLKKKKGERELKKLDPEDFVTVFTTAMFLDLMITNPRSSPENPLYNCIFILWKLVIESYINKQGKE